MGGSVFSNVDELCLILNYPHSLPSLWIHLAFNQNEVTRPESETLWCESPLRQGTYGDQHMGSGTVGSQPWNLHEVKTQALVL